MPIGKMLWNRQHLSCLPVMVFQNLTAWHRQEQTYGKQDGRGSSTMLKLCSLPPTDPAFMEKLKRAHFHICIWKHALYLNVPDLDPVQYGWTKDKAAKSLAAVHVPPNTDLALSYIQELIKCSCSWPTTCKCKLWLQESRDAVFCILCM